LVKETNMNHGRRISGPRDEPIATGDGDRALARAAGLVPGALRRESPPLRTERLAVDSTAGAILVQVGRAGVICANIYVLSAHRVGGSAGDFA
jgi:hypothetical protein